MLLTFNQYDLQRCFEQEQLTGSTLFVKEPVFMLPLRSLRSALSRPPYNGDFREVILRLVGGHKHRQLLASTVHDFLVIAGLHGTDMAYPDLARTSVDKAPIPLRDSTVAPVSGRAPVAAAAADPWGDSYPFRNGDFHDAVTLELIRVPVVTNTGYIMEEATVDQLVRAQQPCPYTRAELTGARRVESDGGVARYALYNGEASLGGEWMAKLRALRRVAGLQEFNRLKTIRTYRDSKDLVARTHGMDHLSDEEFVRILENDFDAHISSAAPRRRMVLGSDLFGKGVRVVIDQFHTRRYITAWRGTASRRRNGHMVSTLPSAPGATTGGTHAGFAAVYSPAHLTRMARGWWTTMGDSRLRHRMAEHDTFPAT